MSLTINSRCFTCTLSRKDPDLAERVTILTLRRVQFPQASPLILTETELAELQSLLDRWRLTLKSEGR